MNHNIIKIIVIVAIIYIAYRYFTDRNHIIPNPLYIDDNYMTLSDTYKGLPGCRSFNSRDISALTISKNRMNQFLKERGLPVTKSAFLDTDKLKSSLQGSEESLYRDLKLIVTEKGLRYPLIIKPSSDTSGNGIHSGIVDFESLFRVVSEHLTNISKSNLIVEEQLDGVVYRILYVNKELVAIAGRSVSTVVGNGVSPIIELIELHNNTLKNSNSKQYPIKLNEPYVNSNGYTMNDILPDKEILKVNNILNYGGGALTYPVPITAIHPDNKAIFDLLLGSDFDSNCLGIDFISKDISVPYHKNGAAILEFNSDPARKLHDVFDADFKDRYMDQIRSLRSKLE
jgi:D-alanine-D-alanine ligase-like ATP-grasp enzyme